LNLHRFEVSNYRPPVNPGIWSQNGRQLHLHVFHFPRFGDIDGDGKLELVYSKGCNEQVAYDLTGRELWRYFEPGRITFDPIREDSLTAIVAGKLACYRVVNGQPHFCVAEGATGKLIRSVAIEPNPVTRDTRCSIVPVADGFVLTRDYWRIEVYSHDLKLQWTAAIKEFGHTVIVTDREELFTGTRLFDAAGKCLWAKPELLDATGETHPDSFRFVGDGFALATGAQFLNLDGSVRWRNPHVHHGQAVRVARHPAGARLCFADQFRYEGASRLAWRGRELMDVESVFTVMGQRGNIVSQFEGVHVPETGDWDGDGADEVFVMNRDHVHMDVRKQTGELVTQLPVGERVFVSDMVVAPVLPGARGAQLVLAEWDAAEEHTHCLIFENDNAGELCPPATELELARFTPY